MAHVQVTVIGLDRIGASFGMALKALNGKVGNPHQFTVTGCDRAVPTIREAAKMGAIDREEAAFDLAVENADLVLLSVPLSALPATYEAIGPSLKAGAVIMDTAPLKGPSLDLAGKYLQRDADGDLTAFLVGVAPIVNPDRVGEPASETGAASADLFADGLMILAPATNCPKEAVRLVADLCDLLSLKQHFLEPAEFDGMAAGMDGLPLLMQLGLFQSLSKSRAWADMQWLGNPAFFLATYRLLDTGGDVAQTLAATVHRNRQNVLGKLDSLIETLRDLRMTLATNDEDLLAEIFQEAIRDYEDWQVSRLTNRFSTEPAPEDTGGGPNLLGLGAFAPRLRGRKKKGGKN